MIFESDNVQYFLVVTIQKMKETHDKNKLCVVVVIELSKVRNCLKNVLLID